MKVLKTDISNFDKPRISPWFFITTLYFAQGIPYVIVNEMSVVMFKSLGASNKFIGYTSLLTIPWIIKFFWGPLVDGKSTKRNWLLNMQIILAICFFVSSFSFFMPSYTIILLTVFVIAAFTSATHDIAIDGYYLYVLNSNEQSLFVGIRSVFYRLAMIFSGGLLVFIAGEIGRVEHNPSMGWSIALMIAGIIFLILFFYHKLLLPKPLDDKPVSLNQIPYKDVFREYISQNKIGIILAFIVLYRFGEQLLLRMAKPFLMDKIELGGLGISTSEVGLMYGTFGVISLLAGGIFGGWAGNRWGIKKIIFPFAILMHSTNLLYVFLSVVKPVGIYYIDLSAISLIFGIQHLTIGIHPIIQFCIILEQFAYGMGFTSFMVYLLYISQGKYKTSQYAISTGIMALGMLISGFLSGMLQEHIGYTWLFILSFLTTIPGMILIFFLPYDKVPKKIN